MTLLSLASKQTWPHVLVVRHLHPDRLILLHSSEPDESLEPARRLKDFLVKAGILAEPCIVPRQVSHTDMQAVEQTCKTVRDEEKASGPCVIHFTGGNKLMATGAFLDAVRHGIPACYLERGNRLYWFERSALGLVTRSDILKSDLTDDLDPLDLLACQMSHTRVLGRPEALVLRSAAQQLTDQEFQRPLFRDPEAFLEITNPSPGTKVGDPLEYSVAAAVLRLGVRRVYRSVRIASPDTRGDQTDFDVVFNYQGRLWLVDCKDQSSQASRITELRDWIKTVVRDIPQDISDRLAQAQHDLEATHYILLKQALLDAQRAGGLLGRVVFVRRNRLPEDVMKFAEDLNLPVITKDRLFAQLKELLGKTPAAPTKRPGG